MRIGLLSEFLRDCAEASDCSVREKVTAERSGVLCGSGYHGIRTCRGIVVKEGSVLWGEDSEWKDDERRL